MKVNTRFYYNKYIFDDYNCCLFYKSIPHYYFLSIKIDYYNFIYGYNIKDSTYRISTDKRVYFTCG